MKNRFIDTYNAHIKRPGADKLLAWLEDSDFFTAPASTRFHLSKEGGLCEHSLNVHKRLIDQVFAEKLAKAVVIAKELCETIAICGLLHDVCKVNFYTVSERNTKDENGKWIQVPYYTVEEKFPFGHGEKSVFIIERFMRLTEEEAVAIRYHMGGFGASHGDYSVGRAFDAYPLALQLHMADLQATHIDEVVDLSF